MTNSVDPDQTSPPGPGSALFSPTWVSQDLVCSRYCMLHNVCMNVSIGDISIISFDIFYNWLIDFIAFVQLKDRKKVIKVTDSTKSCFIETYLHD